jgi:hypothetical protein
MTWSEGGKCLVCGAPIWYPTEWWGTLPPPPTFTCGHGPKNETVVNTP